MQEARELTEAMYGLDEDADGGDAAVTEDDDASTGDDDDASTGDDDDASTGDAGSESE
jgi:hypothetical protein